MFLMPFCHKDDRLLSSKGRRGSNYLIHGFLSEEALSRPGLIMLKMAFLPAPVSAVLHPCSPTSSPSVSDLSECYSLSFPLIPTQDPRSPSMLATYSSSTHWHWYANGLSEPPNLVMPSTQDHLLRMRGKLPYIIQLKLSA